MALICYAGDAESGQRAIAPLRALATPLADMVRPMPYPEIYPPEDDSYHPLAAARTLFLDRVDGDVAETILEHIKASNAMMAVAQLRVLGGAMARVADDATAFAHRKSRIMVNVAALYGSPEDEGRERGVGRPVRRRRSARMTTAPTSTSSATRARRGSTTPTPTARGTGWPRSSAGTTRTTCSA